VNAVCNEFVTYQNGKLRIERREHLGGRFDDRHVNPLGDEVLGHLQPDEPGADDNRRCWSDFDIRSQPGCIFNGPKCADPGVAGDGWPHRSGAHTEHQLVVGNDPLVAGGRRTSRDAMCFPVDGYHFVVDPDIESESVKKLFGSLQGEILFLFDQTADEVRQAAVGERHVAGPLNDRDTHVGIEAAESSCR
jgi:hypothetical protein